MCFLRERWRGERERKRNPEPVARSTAVLSKQAHLEHLSHLLADLRRLLVQALVGHAGEAHAEGARQVEGVEGGLVDDDVGVDLRAEAREVDLVGFGGGEVEEL